MRRSAFVAGVISLSVLLAACASGDRLEVGDVAPDFTLQEAAGGSVSLTEFRNGGPALLYFHMAVG